MAFEALAWGRARQPGRPGLGGRASARTTRRSRSPSTPSTCWRAGTTAPRWPGIPGDRIGFLQVADAPLLDMNLLEWSRHHRCFPGQGTLDVTGVVAATLAAGYRRAALAGGVQRRGPRGGPGRTARDAMRSLVFLEDHGSVRRVPRPRRGRLVACRSAAPPGGPTPPSSRSPARRRVGRGCWTDARLRPGRAAPHQAGDVVAQRRRPTSSCTRRRGRRPRDHDDRARASSRPPVAAVAARAKALLWPAVDRTRGDGRGAAAGHHARRRACTSSSATSPARTDDWQRDFEPRGPGRVDDRPLTGPAGWLGIDHVGDRGSRRSTSTRRWRSSARVLRPDARAPVEEFIEPHGRLRSRALRPAAGRPAGRAQRRADVGPRMAPARGSPRSRFACDDVVAQVRGAAGARRAADAGAGQLLRRPRRPVRSRPRSVLDELRGAPAALRPRRVEGELLHAYTAGPRRTGFHVELLERRGGYDGYGSASTHVRLATQAAHEQRAPTHHLR